ncbi:unnamed protein product, partial [Allacma fusca]
AKEVSMIGTNLELFFVKGFLKRDFPGGLTVVTGSGSGFTEVEFGTSSGIGMKGGIFVVEPSDSSPTTAFASS